jgi:5-methylcytosine-specific restriction endonuclease McrA
MKTCTVCKTELSLDQFHKDAKGKDGHQSQCKKCCSEKKRKKYASDPEKVKFAVSLYVAKNKEKVTVYKKDWYQKNQAELRKNFCENYKKNADHRKEKAKEWKEKNPEKAKIIHRASQAKRRARFREADGHHSASDIEKLLLLQKWKCPMCHSNLRSGFHVDHVHPLSRGGSNWPSNLQCLCPKCNQQKHNKDPIAWAQENGRLL